MKFSYSVEAADLIAAELANTIPALHPDTLIIHVPTITNHVRTRGFDHALRIAKGLSRSSGLRQAPALARLGQHRQVGSRRQDRITKLEGAFRTKNGYFVKNERILLVDDVLTTGATIEAAAKTLKAAGAKTIDAVIFAQAK